MIFFQKKVRLQNLQSSVGKQKMRECEALSFKSLIRKEGYLSNIPLFGDKTINLISRHLNLFTAISQQVLSSARFLLLVMVKNVTETSVTNCPKKSDDDVKALRRVLYAPRFVK